MKDLIINTLEDVLEPIEFIDLYHLCNLNTPEEIKELQEALTNLEEECIIYHTKKDKYILLKNCPGLKMGRLSLTKKGFGFIVLPGEEDLYVDKDNLGSATHNDIVLAEVINVFGKKEGRILKIIKRDLKNLVGEVIFYNNRAYLKLDDDKIKIEVELKNPKNLVAGHKVLATVVKEITKRKYLAEVIKVIGHKDDPGVDILSIAYKYGIVDIFPDQVIAELKNIPDEVSEEELVNRVDLTNEQIFTIDGDDTKDIDDAISLTMDGDNYVLGVHIADVSNYVKENTALGDSAFERGTSSYLADTVIPMIPHQLSNGICSLNEGVIRLTMSCVMTIDKKGKVVKYDIFPSYIKSNKKMTYKHVNNLIVRGIVDEGYEPFKDTLLKMAELADILRKEKVSRGYIDFDLDEPKIIQDENGVCIDVQRRLREKGEMLIEDFMIAANETVATHIFNMDLPFIYRVHGEPNPEKIEDFLNLVKQMGYKLNVKTDDITPFTMQKILNELRDKKEFDILSSMLLRSMKKAEYSKDNIGHFGLASKNYTHFTSPIRRYPDLTVHRLLKTYLVDNDYSMETIRFLDNNLENIAKQSSEREVAAINAEREVDDMKMAEYMESHIGEEFDGIISTVTTFGFFVELPNMIEGLVHVSTIKGDHYNYVKELLSLIGQSTKKRFTIGDKVHVKCVAASKLTQTVDFELCEVKDDRDQE
ncbi:MAG: ribonuclease R [Bacilli bacterium]|nr:ribonuclease R [Bacilli bacterium]